MKPYKTEPTNKYLCRICNTECGVKGFPTHLKMHGIKFKDYVKDNIADFEPTWKMCPVCNDAITSKKTCSRTCGCILRQQTHGVRNIWAEMDDITKENAKRKISEYATIQGQGRNIWAEMSNETRRKAKRKISVKTAARVKGEGNPMFGKRHSPETIQKIFDKRPLNGLEQIIATFLDDVGIEYYYNFFINRETTHSYDFKIKNINLIIEVDGNYWHGHPDCKSPFWDVETTKRTDAIKTKIANERGYDVIRFWESEIKTDFDSVKSKILAEIENRRNNTEC